MEFFLQKSVKPERRPPEEECSPLIKCQEMCLFQKKVNFIGYVVLKVTTDRTKLRTLAVLLNHYTGLSEKNKPPISLMTIAASVLSYSTDKGILFFIKMLLKIAFSDSGISRSSQINRILPYVLVCYKIPHNS